MGAEAEINLATATPRRRLSCGAADCPDLDREVLQYLTSASLKGARSGPSYTGQTKLMPYAKPGGW